METEPQPTDQEDFNTNQYVGTFVLRCGNVYSDDGQFPFAD